jgi:hypothetical protein
MKPTLYIFIAALTVSLLATQADAADCFADYKAKQNNPLRLHYGVVQLNGACSKDTARSEIAKRLNGTGWTLLNVLSVFGPDELPERKDSAGPFYLRY